MSVITELLRVNIRKNSKSNMEQNKSNFGASPSIILHHNYPMMIKSIRDLINYMRTLAKRSNLSFLKVNLSRWWRTE